MNHPAYDAKANTALLALHDAGVSPCFRDRTGPLDQPGSLTHSALKKHGQHLFYLLPLGNPTLRTTRARRLRLKDSLAGGRASRNAGILAKNPHFWDYLQQINLTAYEAEIDARRARHFINRLCRVEGRHELDRDVEAAFCFFALIEQPFLDWLFSAVPARDSSA